MTQPIPALGYLPRTTTRRSSDNVWPLRTATGQTWAERKAQQESKQ